MPERSAERRADYTAQGRAISYWAELHPERPAIRSRVGDRSYGELDARANQLARALRARGLRRGDAVALMCDNRPEFVETYAACMRAGLRLTPVNRHLAADEAGYVVTDCEARAFITDAPVGAAALYGAPGERATMAMLGIGPPLAGFESYEDALGAEDDTPLEDPTPGQLMLYTSGTTGRPKGVHKRPRPPAVENLGGYRDGDVHLCTGPLYHAAPIAVSLISPIGNGATVVLMDRWDAEETLRLIEQQRVTHTHMVPTMFHRLVGLDELARARYDVSSLRAVVHGAAPCPIHVKQAMIEWFGPVIVEYYAATEGFGTVVDSETWLHKPGTVGRPVPPDQVIVGDEEANPIATGEVGLVWLKTLAGERFDYFKDPDETDRSRRGERFTLGDLGYLDVDGFLFLTDRSADLIITGGVNVYPAEVDAVLLSHPEVADAATIGVPDDEWGEKVVAVVELRDAAAASDALAGELVAFCRERLAPFKCPRRVEFVADLPRQENGKLARRTLRSGRSEPTTPPAPA